MPSIDESPFVSQTMWARFLKRPTEVMAALIALILTAPVLLPAMLLVKMTSRGPLLFDQVRTGRNGQGFRPYKLRTMTGGPLRGGGRTPDPNEIVAWDHPRVTPVGRLLRRFRIDELPQLLNVLRGEMALVGPRPTLPEQTQAYDEFQRRRLLIRPGMTGLAQVNGNTSISWEERIKYDVHYVRRHGFFMDAAIVIKTNLIIALGERRFARRFDESPYYALEPLNP